MRLRGSCGAATKMGCMKVKLIEVGDGLGTIMLPLPSRLLKQVGWKEGDEILMDIPMAGSGTVILYKPDSLAAVIIAEKVKK